MNIEQKKRICDLFRLNVPEIEDMTLWNALHLRTSGDIFKNCYMSVHLPIYPPIFDPNKERIITDDPRNAHPCSLDHRTRLIGDPNSEIRKHGVADFCGYVLERGGTTGVSDQGAGERRKVVRILSG